MDAIVACRPKKEFLTHRDRVESCWPHDDSGLHVNVEIVRGAQLSELSGLDAASLPTEFRLFKFGDNVTTKGTFKLDQEGAHAIMAAYGRHGVELAIDYEHDTFNDKLSGPRPAAGWFVPEIRADGLYATNVRWTARATELLRGKEYRYFSPTFEHDKQRRITRLMPLALVNFPATHDQPALVAATAVSDAPITERETMDVTKIVGLKDDASEADITARLAALVDAEKQLATLKSENAEQKAINARLEDGLKRLNDDATARRGAEWVGLVDSAVKEFRLTPAEAEEHKKLTGGELEVAKRLLALRQPNKPAADVVTSKPEAIVGTAAEGLSAAQLAAVEDFKKANPGVDEEHALMGAMTANPAIFAETKGA
jgi:hypothetical protein